MDENAALTDPNQQQQQPLAEPTMQADPSVPQQGFVDYADTAAEDDAIFGANEEFTKSSDLSLDSTPWLPNAMWEPEGFAGFGQSGYGTETIKGVAGGLAEAGWEAADFVKYLVNETAAGWVDSDPFMSQLDREKGVAGLEADANAKWEVPEWVAEATKTSTVYGGMVNDLTQLMGPYLGTLKIVKSFKAVKMVGAALDGLLADGAITEGVRGAAKLAGEGAVSVATGAVFADSRSNLANLVYEATKDADEGLASELRDWAMGEKVNEDDGFIERKLKNAKIDVAFEAITPLAIEGIKLLGTAGKKVVDWQKVAEFTSKFKKAKEDLSGSMPKSREEALDAMFPKQVTADNAVDPTLPKTSIPTGIQSKLEQQVKDAEKIVEDLYDKIWRENDTTEVWSKISENEAKLVEARNTGDTLGVARLEKERKALNDLYASIEKNRKAAWDGFEYKRARQVLEDYREALDRHTSGKDWLPEVSERTGTPTIEILHKGDTLGEATDKIGRGDKSISGVYQAAAKQSGLEQTFREVIESKGEMSATPEAFQAIKESVEAKVKAGEPVDITEELSKVLPNTPLKNADGYRKAWKFVVETTTDSIKRFVPNAKQKEAAAKALVAGIGDKNSLGGEMGDKLVLDTVNDMLKEGAHTAAVLEQAPAQLMEYRFMADHVIGPEVRKLYGLLHHAVITGDKAAEKSLMETIQSRQSYMTQLLDTVEQNLSGAGRLLQSGKVELSPEDAAFRQAFNKYKARNPGATMNDPLYIKTMAATAHELETSGYTPEQANMLWKAAQTAWAVSGKLGKGFDYLTKGVYQELWYNSVLGGIRTMESITLGNPMVWAVGRTLSDITGSAFIKDGHIVRQEVFDELEGSVRYLGEGLMSGLAVLTRSDMVKDGVPRKGFFGRSMAPLDYQPPSPNVISSDSLRQAMGWGLEDKAFESGLGYAGAKMGAWLWDAVGHVVNIPTSRLIPSGDTAFSVTAQRGILWAELKKEGRRRGINDETALKLFAAENIDNVTEDLMLSRASNFRKSKDAYVPENGIFDRDGLLNINFRMTNDIDEARLARPLAVPKGRRGWAPDEVRDVNAPVASDRPLFRVLHHTQEALDSMPMSWLTRPIFPFLKTYGNGIQYLADSTPLMLGSSTNQRAIVGEFGQRAQSRALGRLAVGSALMGAGALAGISGLVELPPPNLAVARQNSKRPDRQGLHTLNLNLGTDSKGTEWKAAVDLSRSSQILDPFFLAARVSRAGEAVSSGQTDMWGGSSAILSSVMELGGTNRLIGAPSQLMNSLVNPTYDTADNVARGLSRVYAPPPAMLRNFKNASDPYMRDAGYIPGGEGIPENIYNSWKSVTPGASTTTGKSYGLFGEARMDPNYFGPEVPVYVRATRALTPVGLVVSENSPVTKELVKFQMQGKALTPVSKRESLNMPEVNGTGQAIKIPLDQYTYTDASGKTVSLWDKYNELFQNHPELDMSRAGKKMTLFESLNDLVSSNEYRAASQGNQVINVGGKRTFLTGNQWQQIWAKYSQHKELTREVLTEFLRTPQGKKFRNPDGETVQDTYKGITQQSLPPQVSPQPNDTQYTEVIGSNG